MTYVTAAALGPHMNCGPHLPRQHVYLPHNLGADWKKDNSPVLNDSPITRLLVNDVHARAIEITVHCQTDPGS